LVLTGVSLSLLASCTGGPPPPTAADAAKFLDEVNSPTLKLNILASEAGWVGENFITDDTEAISARINQEATEATVRFAKAATKFDHVDVLRTSGASSTS
jgi:peptidyl-dipeptidase A